jgi:hypothetical protein
MYPSQLKNTPQFKSEPENAMAKADKKRLDLAVVNCVIMDSRPFIDFHKPGMKQFLSVQATYHHIDKLWLKQ